MRIFIESLNFRYIQVSDLKAIKLSNLCDSKIFCYCPRLCQNSPGFLAKFNAYFSLFFLFYQFQSLSLNLAGWDSFLPLWKQIPALSNRIFPLYFYKPIQHFFMLFSHMQLWSLDALFILFICDTSTLDALNNLLSNIVFKLTATKISYARFYW